MRNFFELLVRVVLEIFKIILDIIVVFGCFEEDKGKFLLLNILFILDVDFGVSDFDLNYEFFFNE